MADAHHPIPDSSGDDGQQLASLGTAYLAMARAALDRANALLKAGETASLTYAALELRRAFESLIYENALRFTEELVDEDYLVWQPGELLERLIEIDPLADADLELHMQDPATGEWIKLGRQQRIGLKALKKRYFKLGSHLHSPSLAQVMRGKPPSRSSLMKLCRECADLIDKDLSASMRIGRMAIHGHIEFECHQCGKRIHRMLNALRTPRNNAPGTRAKIIAKCSNCPASYEIRSGDGAEIRWREQRWQGNCPYPDCDDIHEKWVREVKDGMVSACPKCGKRAVFTQTFSFLPEQYLKRLRKGAT